MKQFFVYLIFLLALMPAITSAATINAASCNYADVLAAVNSASDGDIVSIPAGECTWSSTLVIPSSLSVSIIGLGVDSTYIARSGGKTFDIRPNQGEFVRISNVELLCGVQVTAGSGGPRIKVQDGFRVDHIKIDQTTRGETSCGTGGKVGFQNSWTYGVFDNIEFYHPGPTAVISGFTQQRSEPFGLGPWLEDAGWGGKDFVYLEDSIIHNTYGGNTYGVGSFDGRFGWKIVIRYSNLLDVNWGGHDMHGTNSHSLRAMEVYNNTWRLSSRNGESLTWNGGAGTRGGGYTVFNNRLSTSYISGGADRQPLMVTYYRANNPLGAWGRCDDVQEKFCVGLSNPAPHPFTGDPSTGVACTSDSECGIGNYCVPVDSQIESNGYVCREQTGTGKIDPITGVHSSDPAYQWNNLWCEDNAGGLCTPNMNMKWRVNNVPQIVIGRDVIDGIPRPGYVPYTYPHPLASGSTPESPPVTTCTEADWSFSDGACQPGNTLTRAWTKINSNCEGGVYHPATESLACAYVPMPGDLNNDGRVDILDLVIVFNNFGKRSGLDADFNVTVDVSANGEIDIADLVFVARRYTG